MVYLRTRQSIVGTGKSGPLRYRTQYQETKKGFEYVSHSLRRSSTFCLQREQVTVTGTFIIMVFHCIFVHFALVLAQQFMTLRSMQGRVQS